LEGLDLWENPESLSLRVRVVPRARKCSVQGVSEGMLVVRVAAPPVEGKANEALCGYLADVLGAGKKPDPELEFLHDAVAADFGQMAATCVACHGHFLPDK